MPAAWRERIDARSEDCKRRGEDEQGDCGRHEGHERDPDAHRVQEPQREDEQGHPSTGDGSRGKRDRSTCGRDGTSDCFGAGACAFELFAITGNKEQGIVDGKTKPQAGDEIEGKN